MKRSIFWLLVPISLGLAIAVFALVIPAQAGKPAPALGTNDDDLPPGVEISGVVESFPENWVGPWTISGVVYTATNDTHFSMEEGPFYIGACVEMRYDPASYTAYSIETSESDECGEDAKLYFIGLIEQVPVSTSMPLDDDPPGISGTWTISGTEFVSTFDTELETEHGPLVVGACAEVKYRVVNGVNMADEISSEKLYRCYGKVAFNQGYGYVATFPPDLVGGWVITDTTGMSLSFMTTVSSSVSVHHFPLEIGSCVRVKYFYDQGVNIGVQVKTTTPQQCEGHFIDFQPMSKIYAIVDAMPPTNSVTGTWMLVGVNFTSTESTRIEEEEGPLAVGSCAEAKYDPTNGAMLMHKLESEEMGDCQDEDGSPRFKLFGVVEMMPSGGYTGTWQVSGVSFSVTPSTTLEARHGDFAIGAYVKVFFTYDSASGERSAQIVKTHVAPGYGRVNMHGQFGGWNVSPMGDKIILDGNPLPADPDIDVSAEVQEGDMVWVNGYQDSGEMFITQVLLDQPVYLPLIQQ